MKKPVDRLLFQHVFQWFTLPGKLGLIVLCLLVLMAVTAPWIAPHSPHRSAGPSLSPPSQAHWMGTDQLGLDVWSMVIYGARTSLLIGMGTALLVLRACQNYSSWEPHCWPDLAAVSQASWPAGTANGLTGCSWEQWMCSWPFPVCRP